MKQNAKSWQPTGVRDLTLTVVFMVCLFVVVVYFFVVVIRFKECFLALIPFYRQGETI